MVAMKYLLSTDMPFVWTIGFAVPRVRCFYPSCFPVSENIYIANSIFCTSYLIVNINRNRRIPSHPNVPLEGSVLEWKP